MNSISIQGIDEQLSTLLKQLGLGLEKEKKFTAEHDDLDSLFGAWTNDEFSSIQGKVSSERQIDSEIWQ